MKNAEKDVDLVRTEEEQNYFMCVPIKICQKENENFKTWRNECK